MGLLSDNEEGYDRSRVFDRLDNLKLYGKKYFVAHGTHDDNVHFQQSMVNINLYWLFDEVIIMSLYLLLFYTISLNNYCRVYFII